MPTTLIPPAALPEAQIVPGPALVGYSRSACARARWLERGLGHRLFVLEAGQGGVGDQHQAGVVGDEARYSCPGRAGGSRSPPSASSAVGRAARGCQRAER